MPCPFLREAQVRKCLAAPLRKQIAGGAAGAELCGSPRFGECALFRELGAEAGGARRCPHLEESYVQYCGAAPVAKYVPYSQPQSTRCGGGGHRYCELYLSLARGPAAPDGVAAPGHLFFSPNHMWLDADEDGSCHIGIDALLARVLGPLDAVSFINGKGSRRPSAVLTVHGVDWPMTFPAAVLVERANLHLRAGPDRITADPYGGGWLFEGWELPNGARAELISGARAAAWMAAEVERVSEWVHGVAARRQPAVLNDGGLFAAGLAALLDREETLNLFHQFFGPHASWT